MDLAFSRNLNPYTYECIMNLPENVRYELIDGYIYNMAPPSRIHQEISSFLHGELYIHLKGKQCRAYAAPFGVFFLEDNNDDIKKCKNKVEPDIAVVCDKNKFIDEGCKGAPDFIVEIISPSTKRMDYIKKLALYDEFGVKEYWIVNPIDKSVFVYLQEEGTFGKPEIYTFNDKIKVGIFTNLEIDFSQVSL